MLSNNVTSYHNACMTHILWASIKQKNERGDVNDYGLSTTRSRTIFPRIPGGGGGGGINNRLDRLERQIERLDRRMDQQDRRLDRIERRLGLVKILNTLNTTIKYQYVKRVSSGGGPFSLYLKMQFLLHLVDS